jgi:DNA-binding NarL/FixJ family response regulator
MDGLTCIRLLRERMPTIKIAVLSAVDSDETAREALSLGACAFISKRIDPDELPDALLAAFEESVSEPIGLLLGGDIPAVREAGLTERELQILRALAQGQANSQIAKQFWLAEQTVKFHLTNIYRKLGIGSRTEAVHWAYRHGLLEASLDAAEPALL